MANIKEVITQNTIYIKKLLGRSVTLPPNDSNWPEYTYNFRHAADTLVPSSGGKLIKGTIINNVYIDSTGTYFTLQGDNVFDRDHKYWYKLDAWIKYGGGIA